MAGIYDLHLLLGLLQLPVQGLQSDSVRAMGTLATPATFPVPAPLTSFCKP